MSLPPECGKRGPTREANISEERSFCPYVGLQPFAAEEREYFFGRERDQAIIASSLYAAPVTVLYGASGVGKSSVLGAGVIPGLRAAPRTAVVYFNRWQDSTFLTALKAQCVDEVEAALGKTLGLNAETPLPDLFAALGEAFDGAILIVLDQFEEYFLYHRESETEFDAELAATINSVTSDSGFAIALRDDWLSRLDRFDARIPNLLGNSLRLDHLDVAAAEDAIRKPLAVYNRNFPDSEPITIDDELVQSILDEVRTGRLHRSEFGGAGQTQGQAGDDRIETPFLQLVMERLWDEEINKNHSRVLRLSTFETLGKADRILQGHLENVMTGLSGEERRVCARIFQYLVTPNLKKVAQETSNLVDWAGLPDEQVRAVLQKLNDRRVLRRISPPPRYEILHDVLARPILEWRARYIQARQQAAAELDAAREAAQQEDEARRQRELAAKAEALAAERQRGLEERARALRRTRWLAVASGAAALLAVLAAVLAHTNWKRAQSAAREAQIESAQNVISESYTNLDTDPELSVSLAVYAESDLSRLPAATIPTSLRSEVSDALNRAVQTSWLRHSVTELGKDGVWGVSFTPDGRLMAAAESGGTVRVWDVSSHQQLASFWGSGSEIMSTALSPDGRFLATADLNKRLRIWILSSHQQVAVGSTAERVNAVAFSENGTLLAVGGVNGMVTVYDRHTGKACFNVRAHSNAVTALAFDHAAARLATGSADFTAKVWEVKTGKRVQTFRGHSLSILAVAFSPDGARLATSSGDRTAKVWDIASGHELHTLSGHDNDLVSVCFGPFGNRLATGTEDGRVTLWDAATGQQLMDLIGNKGAVLSMSFDQEGAHLTTGSFDRAVRFWSVPRVHSKAVEDVAFSADGRHLASVSLDGSAELWDPDASHVLRTFENNTHTQLVGVALSRDGRRLATISQGGLIAIYNTAAGKAPPMAIVGGSGSGLSFSPDGRRLASAGPGNTAVVWDVSTGRRSLTLSGHENSVNEVTFSPDGKLLATAGLDWTARVWDANSGKQLYALAGLQAHHSGVIWVAFSPDGQRLATASTDRTSIVWDFKSGKLLPLKGHSRSLEGIAFSPDGTRIATASLDRTARVWDARTGEELLRFTHPAGVEQIAFSPDGKRLATACDDGMVRVFILDDAELLRLARRRITRPWTDQECQEYLHLTPCPRELAAQPILDPADQRQRKY